MASAAQALRRALAIVPALEEPREIVAAMGGRAAFARVLARIPAQGRLPQPGTPARKRYNREIRALQRYTTSAGQRRGQGGGRVSTRARDAAVKRWRRAARVPLIGARYARLRGRGAAARLAGWVIVEGSDGEKRRRRVMPAGGDGLLTPLDNGWLDLAEGGQWVAAALGFLRAFSGAYGVEISEDDDTDFEWIRIWPRGDPEPRTT